MTAEERSRVDETLNNLLQKLADARFAVSELDWAIDAAGLDYKPGELPNCELDDIIQNVEGLRDRIEASRPGPLELLAETLEEEEP